MPKIMAQYPRIESISSIGSIILGFLQVQAALKFREAMGWKRIEVERAASGGPGYQVVS